MKSVSWEFAFRKLNEWREHDRPLTFGPAGEVELHGDTTMIFSGTSGTRVVAADETTGLVQLFGEGVIDLSGATFRYSEFEDSPFDESNLSPDEFRSQLEASLPDGKVFVFAENWELKP